MSELNCYVTQDFSDMYVAEVARWNGGVKSGEQTSIKDLPYIEYLYEKEVDTNESSDAGEV